MGAAVGVVLDNGDYLTRDVVASSVDPHLTFLKMVGAEHLPDEFVEDVRRYKFRGSSGKVNLALDALPDFTRCRAPGPHLRGADLDLPQRRLHGARLRRRRSTGASRAAPTSTW